MYSQRSKNNRLFKPKITVNLLQSKCKLSLLEQQALVWDVGLSLGEYCALVFAGVLSFEDGLRVVKARADSMAAAATLGEPSASRLPLASFQVPVCVYMLYIQHPHGIFLPSHTFIVHTMSLSVLCIPRQHHLLTT